MLKSLFRAVFSCAALLAVSSPWARAQTPAAPAEPAPVKISILHRPPPLDEIPLPGQEMTLTISLAGTKNTQLESRAMVVNDGRIMDVPMITAGMDDYDRAVYKASFNAPVADVSYQFVVYPPQGNAIISTRYRLRRECIPNVDLTEMSVNPNTNMDERLKRLLLQARGLERDIRSYESALKLVDQLKEQVKE